MMKKVTFKGINNLGELVFKNKGRSKEYTIDYLEAQKSIRVKGDKQWTGDEENVLVWEEGENQVVIIGI